MGRGGCFVGLSRVKTPECGHITDSLQANSSLINLYLSLGPREAREGFGERDFTIFCSRGVMSSHLP